MAVPATLPSVSEQSAISPPHLQPASSHAQPRRSAADGALHSTGDFCTSSAVPSASASASLSACCPSLDACLVRLEAAFMSRSEEKHQQAVSRLLSPLLASPHSPGQCPRCADSEAETGAGGGAERADSERDADTTTTAASALTSAIDSGVGNGSDGMSRNDWLDGSLADEPLDSHNTSAQPQPESQGQAQHQPHPHEEQSAELCFHCRWRACQLHSSAAVQCLESVVQTVGRVELAKALEGPVKAFQRHNTTGQPFREDVARIIDLLCNADEADLRRLDSASPVAARSSGEQQQPIQRQAQQPIPVKGPIEECKVAEDVALYDVDEDSSYERSSGSHERQQRQESSRSRGCPALPVGLSPLCSSRSRRAVLAATLLCCKFATENAPFNLRKSEIVKRKIRGLRLLLHLLQRVPHAYRSTRGGVMLLRRFVCPSLLTACITDVPVVFRLVLSIFRYLYDASYRQHLLIELGTLVDMMFLPLLESTHCTIQQKRDIVDSLAHCCANSQQVVALYYNFDNRIPTWPLFERCVAVVAQLSEGDIKYSKQPTGGSSRHATLERPIGAVQQQLGSSAAQVAGFSSLSAPSLSSTSPASSSGSTSPSSSSSSADAADDSSHVEALRKSCLRLLVHLLHMQAQWLGVPGVQRPLDGRDFPPPASIPAISPAGQLDAPRQSISHATSTATTRALAGSVDIHVTPPSPVTHHASLGTATTSSSSSSSPSSSPSELESALLIHEKRMAAAARNSTWMSRVDQQKADADIERRILKLARNDGLSKAVRELRVLHPQSAWPSAIAMFIHRHESKLDKAEVGELLSGLSDSLLAQPEYDSLRDHYLALLDFCGLSFDSALRVFLTSSGFRLPGEAQKIDRMLASFCKAYVKDSPGTFPNADAAFILAFALVMLNTDQHNASMKGRQPMTEQQFISNLRGVNNGVDFPRSMLAEAYLSIKSNEIAFLADRRSHSSHSRHATLGGSHSHSPSLSLGSAPPASAGASAAGASAEGSGEVARSVSKYKALRDSACRSYLEQLVRKSLAYLKNSAVQQRLLYLPVDSRIVIGLYEVSWLKCCAAITATLESTQDVETLHCCLDGLMYGACIAVALRLPMERQAWTRVLAKLTFMDKQCGAFSSASLLLNNVSDEQAADCQRRVLAGDHLRQEWCRAANLYSDKQPLQAIQLLQHTARDAAKKLNSERRLSLVKQLHDAFGGEIALTDNRHRALVKQGKLTKVSADGKRRTYFFFLFNDILVYASAGVQQQYKCHRCLHLSLCRIEDISSRSARADSAAAEAPLTPPTSHVTEPSVSSRPGSAPSAASSPAYSASDEAAADAHSTTFRLVSPQKSILLCADSADKKRAWIGALLTQIRQQAKKRSEYVRQTHRSSAAATAASAATANTAAAASTANNSHANKAQSGSNLDGHKAQERSKAASPSALASSTAAASSAPALIAASIAASSNAGESDTSDELRRYSTFIGNDWSSRAAASTSSSSSSSSSSPSSLSLQSRRAAGSSLAAHGFCKLCLRSFSLFRRRFTCDWCSDAVCPDCADNRLALPSSQTAAAAFTPPNSASAASHSAVSSKARSTSDPAAAAAAAAASQSREQRGGEKARVCDACCGVLTGAVALTETDTLYTVCRQ